MGSDWAGACQLAYIIHVYRTIYTSSTCDFYRKKNVRKVRAVHWGIVCLTQQIIRTAYTRSHKIIIIIIYGDLLCLLLYCQMRHYFSSPTRMERRTLFIICEPNINGAFGGPTFGKPINANILKMPAK